MKQVFIDGSAGTTGLRIAGRLAGRRDIRLIALDEAHRKDVDARRQAMREADIVFWCLPDAAAREAETLLADTDTVIIDTSTAHRVAEGWVYGLPELPGQREAIRTARRIANPGCHASGAVALIAPLVAAGVLPRDAFLTCFSLTGYSGGGKPMIAQYEDPARDSLLDAPRLYGLSQAHKHLPEIVRYGGLTQAPAFCPVVAPYYAGMEVVIPVSAGVLRGGRRAAEEAYRAAYAQGLIRFVPGADEGGFLSAGAFSGRDDMQVSVFGNDERVLLVSRFDNLGKGASGAAIQNMNILLGVPEATGLQV